MNELTEKIEATIKESNFNLHSIKYLPELGPNTAALLARYGKIAQVVITRGSSVYTASITSDLKLGKAVLVG